eukprot:Seg824.2 transcript_id=Seg824.2/GoldUCD/mRNA.D3Y31 product="Transmembrane protein 198" protein_id=Seg824.2/GoldUCD/D3Y31
MEKAFLLTFAMACIPVYTQGINMTLQNNSKSHNISGLTNQTLSKGINFSCKWNFNFKIVPVAVAGIFMLSGLVILTVGYRKRRIAFFLVGFIGTTILAYLVCVSESNFSGIILVLVSVAAGLFVSLFTTTLLYVGYFVTGLFAGLALGFAAVLVYTTFQLLHSIAIPCVAIAAISLVQVFITLWWRRVMLITSTAILGSTMLAGGLDYFVEGLFMLKYAEQKIFYSRVAPLCWYSFVILGIWPTLFIISMLVQFLWTGKEKHKTNYVFIYRRRKSRNQEEHIGLTAQYEMYNG